jgi:hypothetical protein
VTKEVSALGKRKKLIKFAVHSKMPRKSIKENRKIDSQRFREKRIMKVPTKKSQNN